MKQLTVLLLFFAVALRAFPQCSPDTTITQVGFYPPDSLLDCIERGIYYDEVIQFKNFTFIPGSAVGFPGITLTVISVQIDSIHNLPSGINYTCQNPNCFYTTGENGCVRIMGTTSDPTGEYNLGFYATVVVDFMGTQITANADSQLLADNGLGYKLKVINQGEVCRILPECSPDTFFTQVGLYPPDTLLDCVEDGIYFDEVIQFENFTTVPGSAFGFPGINFTILSVRLDSIHNVPSGLSYSCSNPNCYYITAENGCVRIKGTTNAPPGDYYLGFFATVVIDFQGSPLTVTADSQMLANNGLSYKLTVIAQGTQCPNFLPGQISINASAATGSFCEGDTIQLHATAGGGSPPYDFAWSPGGYLSDPDISNPLLYPTNPGIYTVTVTDNFGLSASDDVVIAYGQIPVISLTQDITICAGQSVQLQASGGASCFWSPSSGLSAANVCNPAASPAVTTVYTVAVSNANCSASAAVTVEVDATSPQASFNPIKNNFTVLFNNTSTDAASYYWDFGDGESSSLENPQHNYSQLTAYQVTLIATGPCGKKDTITSTVDLSVGIQNISAGNFITVYPNPGTGLFNVAIAEDFASDILYEVISVHGEVVKSGFFKAHNNFILPLDLSAEARGIYFVKAAGDNFWAIKKLIVQ